MKKTLALLILVGSILAVGCGSDPGVTVGAQRDTNQGAGLPQNKQAGAARMSPMAAPPGVKTGTPGN
ncbi:MAG: hypothetical protein JST12_09140 [Armatimonadetes bacterium]|nr:hypothetical protein [Armatimonadota bacterium]MBS1701813.1 hypothetical protein [Armatimonadota bacterium]MBS1728669.1 hypothetical protein [Armatimonadota bacterium]